MRTKWLVPVIVSALFLMACDISGLVGQVLPQTDLKGIQATLEAVATEAPAAIASVVATMPAAPKAPATVVPGAGAGTGNPFTAALGQAKTATKFRIQLSMIVGSTTNGKYAEQPFMDFTGEVDGTKAHMTSKGGILAMLAKDANTPVEIIAADGKSYMKGISMFGMADSKVWYIMDANSASGFTSMTQPDQYKDWIGGANAADIKKMRTENFDGQSCDVYLYSGKSTQFGSLLGMLSAGGDTSDLSAVDKTDMNVWLCKDGYVHQFSMDYQGHDSKDAAQKGALKMTMHMWDYNNAAISVTAPKDAKPLPTTK